MNKEDLALDNLQWLICHKTKQNLIYLFGYTSSMEAYLT